VARRAGAEVVARPAELAEDATHTEPVLVHALEWLRAREGYGPEVVVLLQPTTPLRGAAVIDRGAAAGGDRVRLRGGRRADSERAPAGHPRPGGALGAGIPLPASGSSRSRRRRNIPKTAAVVFRLPVPGDLRQPPGRGRAALVMDPLESVDIDDAADLARAGSVAEGNFRAVKEYHAAQRIPPWCALWPVHSQSVHRKEMIRHP